MLREIRSNVFLRDGKPRDPIVFQPGLNTISGSSGGSNAIGKSTFLMIIDFIFGGDSYTKLTDDVKKHIGNHTIFFSFRFGEQDYYFARSTDDITHVSRCDSNYGFIYREALDEYRQFLFDEYEIGLSYLSFNEIVERFFRIYGRDNTSERYPLNIKPSEKPDKAVNFLAKLLGRFKPLESVETAEAELDVKISASKPYLSVFDGTKIEQNIAGIQAMQSRLDKLLLEHEDAEVQVMSVDTRSIEKAQELTKEIQALDRKRRMLLSQLNAVEGNIADDSKHLVDDFDSLLQYFPDANIKKLSEVEHFHEKIGEILSVEIQAEIDRLKSLISYYNREIKMLQDKIKELGIAREISRRTLSQCVNVSQGIDRLKQENEELEKERERHARRLSAERLLSDLLERQAEVLADIQKTVNDKMSELNSIITNGEEVPPGLVLGARKSLDFKTPDNTSEGTSYKSLITYDLSMIALTPLPALIHDSNILVHIKNSHLERILEQYQSCGKQVFIAFDKIEKCTPKVQEILNSTTRLQLGDGNELFGLSWSKCEKEAEQSEESKQDGSDQ